MGAVHANELAAEDAALAGLRAERSAVAERALGLERFGVNGNGAPATASH